MYAMSLTFLFLSLIAASEARQTVTDSISGQSPRVINTSWLTLTRILICAMSPSPAADRRSGRHFASFKMEGRIAQRDLELAPAAALLLLYCSP